MGPRATCVFSRHARTGPQPCPTTNVQPECLPSVSCCAHASIRAYVTIARGTSVCSRSGEERRGERKRELPLLHRSASGNILYRCVVGVYERGYERIRRSRKRVSSFFSFFFSSSPRYLNRLNLSVIEWWQGKRRREENSIEGWGDLTNF